jgi:phosphoenolpyruvate-protein kinase (PTS system EI component)
VCHLQVDASIPVSRSTTPDNDRTRLEQAFSAVSAHVGLLEAKVETRLSSRDREILSFYQMVLDDRQLRCRMIQDIDERRLSAESAVRRGFTVVRTTLRRSKTEYLRERATDIAEIEGRLLQALCNTGPFVQCAPDMRCALGECRAGRAHVVVLPELTPAAVLDVASLHTVAFVADRGGPTSHAAILARALCLPAVSGIRGEDIARLRPPGSRILVDGNTGEIIINPSARTLANVARLRRNAAPHGGVVHATPELQVLANINRSTEVVEAVNMEAEGVGLYRTEMELLAAGRLYDEEEQYEQYAAVVEAMGAQPVYIRLLDLGADKSAAFIDLPPEENPQLGRRGARLLLGRPDLLRPQARAIARASRRGPLRVLYPMITSLERFLELKASFEEVTSDLPIPRLQHGVLLEVPAACLQAAEILAVADFACIGTNDLIQYLFAADRNNEDVACDYAVDSPVLWSLIGSIATAADQARKDLLICGELAGDPDNLSRIMDAGIRSVSVHPRRIPDVRRAVAAARRSQ